MLYNVFYNFSPVCRPWQVPPMAARPLCPPLLHHWSLVLASSSRLVVVVCYFFTWIIATIFGRWFIAHLLRPDLSNASRLTEHTSVGLGSWSTSWII